MFKSSFRRPELQLSEGRAEPSTQSHIVLVRDVCLLPYTASKALLELDMV